MRWDYFSHFLAPFSLLFSFSIFFQFRGLSLFSHLSLWTRRLWAKKESRVLFCSSLLLPVSPLSSWLQRVFAKMSVCVVITWKPLPHCNFFLFHLHVCLSWSLAKDQRDQERFSAFLEMKQPFLFLALWQTTSSKLLAFEVARASNAML